MVAGDVDNALRVVVIIWSMNDGVFKGGKLWRTDGAPVQEIVVKWRR